MAGTPIEVYNTQRKRKKLFTDANNQITWENLGLILIDKLSVDPTDKVVELALRYKTAMERLQIEGKVADAQTNDWLVKQLDQVLTKKDKKLLQDADGATAAASP